MFEVKFTAENMDQLVEQMIGFALSLKGIRVTATEPAPAPKPDEDDDHEGS